MSGKPPAPRSADSLVREIVAPLSTARTRLSALLPDSFNRTSKPASICRPPALPDKMVAAKAGEVEAMRFPLNVYWLAVIGSGAITAATLPLWRVLCRRLGLVDDPGIR